MLHIVAHCRTSLWLSRIDEALDEENPKMALAQLILDAQQQEATRVEATAIKSF